MTILPDPANLAPDQRKFLSDALATRAQRSGDPRERANLGSLADLYAHCPRFYPAFDIPPAEHGAQRIGAAGAFSPIGSPAGECADLGVRSRYAAW